MVDSRKNSQFPRMHWTDDQVRHLIQVVRYVDEEYTNRKLSNWGKWISVSELMTQKGFSVSGRQCFDKFRDLDRKGKINRKGKRPNDLLGKGTAEKVVKNPALLDSMDHLPETTKPDVRKLLGSRPLFYQEIRNYHSRLPTAADYIGMQSSTPDNSRTARAMSGMSPDNSRTVQMQPDSARTARAMSGLSSDNSRTVRMQLDNARTVRMQRDYSRMQPDYSRTVRMQRQITEERQHGCNQIAQEECMRSTAPENLNPVMSGMLPDSARIARMQRQKELKVDLQAHAFELEKERLKWEKIELKRLKLDIEKMKLENERMALEMKQKELDIESNRSEAAMTPHAPTLERFQGRQQI